LTATGVLMASKTSCYYASVKLFIVWCQKFNCIWRSKMSQNGCKLFVRSNLRKKA